MCFYFMADGFSIVKSINEKETAGKQHQELIGDIGTKCGTEIILKREGQTKEQAVKNKGRVQPSCI